MCVDFFFKLNLLPPYFLCSQGDNVYFSIFFPAFEECYTFMLQQSDNWLEQVATIQVLELENGNFFIFFNTHLGYSLNFTVVCHYHVMGAYLRLAEV